MTKVLVSLAVTLCSATAFAQYTTTEVTNGGKITGKVTYAGTPNLPPEKRNKDPQICGTDHPNETIQTGTGGGLKYVIVYIKDITSGKALTPTTADIDQKGCTYDPHVQALPVGSTLNVLNSDPLLHNIHASMGAATVFNYAMPVTVKKIPKKLTKAGFVKIKCDVHSWMNGALGVMDNPYYAVTGDDGSFSISDVPAGTYTVVAWQERLTQKTSQVTVAAGAPAAVNFAFSGQ